MQIKRSKTKAGISNELIRTYGLYWKLEDVFFGRGNKAGHLNGALSKSAKSLTVNFRDQVGIYVLYSDYKIIYIGQAGFGYKKLFDRLKQHTNDNLAGRWNQFSWYGLSYVLKTGSLSAAPVISHIPQNTLLNHIEGILIHACEPPLNRQGGRWGKNVKHYFQQKGTT